ncbi:MAG: cysteine desulfurase [Mesorhizobium sp.]|uniref:cysteine desulfurase family protein n=1 Tax=Mesorhizobium sp. TaxID=1871066 RepID=UPI000FE89E1D|nr:cysteine desulfurase family protein [Mesorhizobium sp.]RWH76842.1 MAG: cysteine desulfurase [Mesorhizobium sp.]RWH80151.1 MAG: cysteine desulfurase [Mesorhizobium sp.]RWH88770.1 MAG: cysteine desulfurase [Mesorhizobium sp.]RWH95627.1 MAG: cysteine desulfurase [Mesorhizobium sp.]RWI01312.1 MAG: cysteine desulfurase [Mesorhizobium sp.]
MKIYLDANATTGISAAARAAMYAALDEGPHNPSSSHQAGSRARQLLERARQEISGALGGVDSENVFFTSGGTEANNLVIRGFDSLAGVRICCTAVEHASVMGPVADSCPTVLPVRADGVLDLPRAIEAVTDCAAATLVCVQAANSETGIVQPLQEIVPALRGIGDHVYVMTDAAQAFGRVPIDLDGIDVLTFSGHKLHAPAGTGFLYLSDHMLEALPLVLKGGGQEGGVRPGTQNVAGACGLAAAVKERMESFQDHAARLCALRNRLEDVILQAVPGARIVGKDAVRVPNTANVMFPGLDGQALLARLDEAGVYCSTGSACSSARPEASPVLKAMGMSEREASSCLRFSVSLDNTPEEMDAAAAIVGRCVERGLRISQ